MQTNNCDSTLGFKGLGRKLLCLGGVGGQLWKASESKSFAAGVKQGGKQRVRGQSRSSGRRAVQPRLPRHKGVGVLGVCEKIQAGQGGRHRCWEDRTWAQLSRAQLSRASKC